MKLKLRLPRRLWQLAIRCLIVLGLWLIFVPNFLDPLSDRGLGPVLVQLRSYTEWMDGDPSGDEEPMQLASLDSLPPSHFESDPAAVLDPMAHLDPLAELDPGAALDFVVELDLADELDPLVELNPMAQPDPEVAPDPTTDPAPEVDLVSVAALEPGFAPDDRVAPPPRTDPESPKSGILALIESPWGARESQESWPTKSALGDERFDCIIEPSEQVEVGSAETGVLEKVHFERSEKVEKGQVVAELESDVEKMSVRVARKRASMDANRRSAEASFDLGKRREERASELYEGNALSLDLREEIETETELAHLKVEEAMDLKRLNDMELARAEAALRRRLIRSPISGVVVERHKSAGEVVKEEGILTIAQVDPLRIEVILPAHLYGTLEPGMKGRVIPEAPLEGAYEASIEIVDRVIDGASGTFGVRLDLPNPDLKIPSGLHCQIAFYGSD